MPTLPDRQPVTFPINLVVELGTIKMGNGVYAAIKANNHILYSDFVYDTAEAPAELNIMHLFADKLRRLLEDDD